MSLYVPDNEACTITESFLWIDVSQQYDGSTNLAYICIRIEYKAAYKLEYKKIEYLCVMKIYADVIARGSEQEVLLLHVYYHLH